MVQKTSSLRRGGYSGELENWLNTNASLMGHKSSFPGLVAAIEKGGNGGNSGTKGCGTKFTEPFENWDTWGQVFKAFDRSERCERSFRALTTYERWLLCGRYLLRKETLPVGLLSQLGELAAVAAIVADRLGALEQFLADVDDNTAKRWEGVAIIALELAHKSFALARADVDSEANELAGEAC